MATIQGVEYMRGLKRACRQISAVVSDESNWRDVLKYSYLHGVRLIVDAVEPIFIFHPRLRVLLIVVLDFMLRLLVYFVCFLGSSSSLVGLEFSPLPLFFGAYIGMLVLFRCWTAPNIIDMPVTITDVKGNLMRHDYGVGFVLVLELG